MKSRHEIDWHRLVRYLSGEYEPGQEEELQAWIVDDEDRARLMDELNRVWKVTDESAPPRDVDAAWREVRAELQRTENFQKDDTNSGRQSFQLTNGTRSSVQRSRTYRRFLRIAVIAGLAGIVVWLSVFLLKKSQLVSPSSDTRVFTTEKGQRAAIRLADGTRVHLNVDSQLTLSVEEFETGRREVHLEGEAYFEVADDANRPFVVHSEGATAEVLGTAFDVKAYASDREVQVAVTEGKVTLRPGQPGVQDTVLLRSRHLGVVAGQQIQAVHRGVDLSSHLAWKEGRLVFRDTPFSEVTQKLERWYDLRVEAGIASSEVDRLNAEFDDESLTETLQAVAAALGLQYEQDGRAVTFYRAETDA
jgi:ferric-dicitrate binding protein FerR (iron transport regulator)